MKMKLTGVNTLPTAVGCASKPKVSTADSAMLNQVLVAVVVLVLVAAPVLALPDSGRAGQFKKPYWNEMKIKAYKLFKCDTTANLDENFVLKSTCPRQGRINGEDLTVQFIRTESTADGAYARFKVYTGGKGYEFLKEASWQPVHVGNYDITVSAVGILSAGDQTVWGWAQFSVSKI